MLQIRYDHSGVNPQTAADELNKYTERLKRIRQSATYDQPESSLNLPDDDQLYASVNELVAQKVSDKLKYCIVIGIGGSNLGTKAVYDAEYGYRDILEPARYPKMLFAETTDPEWLNSIIGLIRTLNDPAECLVIVISKSGSTTETLANFEVIADALRDKFGDAHDRMVAITDHGSKLMQAAEVRHVACLAIEAPVGGRYSVFSAVGLFPLAAVGINIEEIRTGARMMLDRCLNGENLAALSAAVLAEQYKHGLVINDNFFFHTELESVGKWYRQLMGESIGKEQSLDGETVHTGITPTVSLGSTDLHSVGQLYLGGPKNKLTTFVASNRYASVPIPADRFFPDLVPVISGKTAEDIMKAIYEGVKLSYQKVGLPYMEVILDSVGVQSIAAYLQFKMLEMMYLGQMLNVNSFDQPNVEMYKIETKRILEA